MMAAGYREAREGVAVRVRADRSLVQLTGADRASYLQGLLTNDILALSPGTGCYALYLTPQGRIIADMNVLALDDRVLLDAPAVVRAVLVRRLEEFVIAEEVQVRDLSDEWTSVGVYGPAATAAVAGALAGAGDAAAALPSGEVEHRAAVAGFRGAPLVVATTREAGVPGLALYLPRELAASLVDALRAGGVAALAPEAFEVLRIEAGRPAFGVDMDEHTIPLEAGLEDRAISFTKGCYVGQEIIVRILHRGRGRVARRLAGLLVEARGENTFGTPVPPRGASVWAGAVEVGRVTSAAYSPALGRPIALAMLQREAATPGAEVTIREDERSWSSQVTTLPFIRS